MGTLLPENRCAHRKGAIEDLIQGLARDTAAQLQILFGNPTGDHDGPKDLLVELLTSFTVSLSHVSLSSCEHCECEVNQIPNQVGSPIGDQRSVDPGESSKRPAAEDRSGCSKRRKTSEMRMEDSTTNEDGHAGREYGQKEILDAQFPKSYSLNNPSQKPLLEAHLRSFSSKTFSDSESHSRSFSSISISTQYASSCPSSASSVRKECGEESREIARYLTDPYMDRSLEESSWDAYMDRPPEKSSWDALVDRLLEEWEEEEIGDAYMDQPLSGDRRLYGWFAGGGEWERLYES